MVGENGIPETPDWQPTPKPSPFDAEPVLTMPLCDLGEN